MKKTVAFATPQLRPPTAYRPVHPSEATTAVAHEIGSEAATFVAQHAHFPVGMPFTVHHATNVPRDELVVALSREYSDEPDPGTPITFVSTDGNQHTFFRNM